MLKSITKKVSHLLRRMIAAGKAIRSNTCEFSLVVALYIFWDTVFLPGKSKQYIKAISLYMQKELGPITKKYLENNVHENMSNKKSLDNKVPVWIFWWQGEENMPDLVKACIYRIKLAVPQDIAQLYIITRDNFEEYIDFPQFITEKQKNGLLSIQAFSDVLRYALMSTYGGLWLDATDYLSGLELIGDLDSTYFTQRFSTEEKCPREACRGKWCNFYFMGQANNCLFQYVYDALLFWWEKHDKIVDYVIVDYIIWTAYCNIPQIRRLIDAVPANNENIWELAKHLNDPYENTIYQELLQCNGFFKLSYKGNLRLETPDGRKTIYRHILEENGVI